MVDGGQVEYDEGTVEPESVGRRSVEHAPQVAVDESTQFEGHVATVLDEFAVGGRQIGGGPLLRVEERVDHLGERR